MTAPADTLPPVRPAAVFLMVASLLTLAAGATAMDALRALAGDPGTCGFRARFGLDCLGCGGTRAFDDVARGRLSTGFERNPIGAMSGVAVWATLLAAASSWWRRRWEPIVAVLIASTLALAVTVAVHGVRWWRALPPGLDL